MAKDKSKDKKKNGKASASAASKVSEPSKVVANARLVAAIKGHTEALGQAKSYLVTMAEIIQNEQLTKAEVIASIMEARGIDKKTAGEQYSRSKKIFTDPDTLEQLKAGEIDLKTARQATAKKQENPSAAKKQANAEKNMAKAITTIVNIAKESGTDIATLLATVKAAAKKAGLK